MTGRVTGLLAVAGVTGLALAGVPLAGVGAGMHIGARLARHAMAGVAGRATGVLVVAGMIGMADRVARHFGGKSALIGTGVLRLGQMGGRPPTPLFMLSAKPHVQVELVGIIQSHKPALPSPNNVRSSRRVGSGAGRIPAAHTLLYLQNGALPIGQVY